MAFGRQAAGSGVGGVVKEVGVEQAAAGSQELQYPLIDALDLMAVAQVVGAIAWRTRRRPGMRSGLATGPG